MRSLDAASTTSTPIGAQRARRSRSSRAELSGVAWSLTTHRWDIGENNLLALKTERASFVRAINQPGLEKIAAITHGNPSRLLVLHVGVDLPPESVRVASANGRRVLVAASLREVKGHVYLLQAVELLKQRGTVVYLDCVGDGPLRGRLERQVAESRLEAEVTFTGALSHSELLERLASGRWSAVVLGSIVTPDGEHEGIPVSLLEAMSVGVPAIGAATGGIPDLLGDGAGVLVPERDPVALADAIERVLDDPDLRRQLDVGRPQPSEGSLRRRDDRGRARAAVCSAADGRCLGSRCSRSSSRPRRTRVPVGCRRCWAFCHGPTT